MRCAPSTTTPSGPSFTPASSSPSPSTFAARPAPTKISTAATSARPRGRASCRVRVDADAVGIDAGHDGSHWVGYATVIQRRPWTALIAGTLVIVALAVPLKDFRLGFPDAGNDPAGTMTRQAYDMVAAGFGPGASGPLMLTAELPRGGGDPQRALTLLRERVAAQPQVQSAAAAQLNRTRDAAVLMAIPRSSPQEEATQELVDELRADILPAVERSTGMTVNVGGMSAATVDQAEYTLARLPLLFLGRVAGLSSLLLLVAFRSILVPIKAAVLNLLSIFAAYGVVAARRRGRHRRTALRDVTARCRSRPSSRCSCSRSCSASRWTTRCSSGRPHPGAVQRARRGRRAPSPRASPPRRA